MAAYSRYKYMDNCNRGSLEKKEHTFVSPAEGSMDELVDSENMCAHCVDFFIFYFLVSVGIPAASLCGRS